MFKKVFSVILVLALAITSAPLLAVGSFAADWEDALTYTKYSAYIKITRCNTSASGSLVIPSVIEGLPVTSIGEYAFSGCTSITSVTIPNSVTSIGSSAFDGCASLTSVTIGSGVTSIGDNAFYGCNKLTAINVDTSNKNYSSADGVLFDKAAKTLIRCPGGKAGAYTIPNSVTSIEDDAFYGCSKLTSVTIPNSVKSIGGEAFCDCTSLASVTIGTGVTSIGEEAFYCCISLTSVTIGIGVTSIGNGAFQYCKKLTNVTIPNSVTSIGDSAFSCCEELTGVTIGTGVTSIGNWAFRSCASITSVTIPNSVTSIGSSAFDGCASLTSVTIGSGVTSIGGGAFEDCTSLTSVTIGSGVTSIGGGAFRDCSSLTNITIPNSVTSIGDDAFSGTAYYNNAANWEDGVLYIGKYLIVAKNNEVSGAYTINAGTLCIANSAFYQCPFTSVTIPNSVTSIGSRAFEYCSSLKSVTIPNSVTSIGSRAFEYCSSLKSVTIPNSVTSIGDSAFSCCEELTGVTIGTGVTSIGDYAFYCCSSLKSVTIGNGVTSIGYAAFYGCTSLTSVTIGSGVTSIREKAFYGCISLTSVTIPDSVTSIGSDTFHGCSTLTSVTIPNSVTSIGDRAFGYYYDDIKVNNFTIRCYKGTAGEKYAIDNNLSYTLLSETATLSGVSVKTNPTKTSYYVGDTLNTAGLTLTATYNNGTTQTISTGFTCSPTTLSTAGTQAITVTYQGKTTTFNVTVKAVPVNSVKLNATSASVVIGATKQLTATVSPSNAANKAVTWSSSNTAVATVSTSGVVTAKGVGKATVTCKAKDGSGKSATCVITVVPKTPTNVKAASASYNSIKITWTAVSGATGYTVYRATSKTGTYTNLGSVTGASFTDKKAATGTTYYYKVRAYKTVGETKYLSGYSAIVSAKAIPAVPASFTAVKASTTSVKTTWKAVTGATGYEVWMATSSSGTYSKITTIAKTTYTKTGLTKNKTYYFKVRAYTTVGSTKVYGAFTAVKSAKPY